jgi:hypothetical protein
MMKPQGRHRNRRRLVGGSKGMGGVKGLCGGGKKGGVGEQGVKKEEVDREGRCSIKEGSCDHLIVLGTHSVYMKFLSMYAHF